MKKHQPTTIPLIKKPLDAVKDINEPRRSIIAPCIVCGKPACDSRND